jgi:hypothetical protein
VVALLAHAGFRAGQAPRERQYRCWRGAFRYWDCCRAALGGDVRACVKEEGRKEEGVGRGGDGMSTWVVHRIMQLAGWLVGWPVMHACMYVWLLLGFFGLANFRLLLLQNCLEDLRGSC